MSHKTKQLFIKRIGITESEVKSQTNKMILLDWLVELNKISSELKGTIFELVARYKSGEQTEQGKYARLKKYNRSLGAMKDVIKNRLSEIKQEEKELNNGRIERHLIDVFRETLSEEAFDNAYKIAIQRAGM